MLNKEEMNELQEYTSQILLASKIAVIALSEDEELLDSIAKATKKMYDSYVKAGFTQEQAFELISKSDVLKVMGNSK